MQKLWHLLRYSSPNMAEARRLHALLLVSGFFNPNPNPNSNPANSVALGTQLVKAYVKLGHFDTALLVLERLYHNNKSTIVACNALLRGYVDAGQFSQAIGFFHRFLVVGQGLVPDNFTYPLVLKACAGLSALEQGRKFRDLIRLNETRYGMVPNIYVKCALIDMFAKCGSLPEARTLFEDMPQKDLASWTAIISGSVQNGEWLQALCLFKRMRSQGLVPDSVIVAAVLPACGRLEAKQAAAALQGCAVRSGFCDDLFVSNALMDTYCKCGDTHHASLIFHSMSIKDVVSWSSMIAGYSQNCQYDECIELYLQMNNLGLRTNAIIAASVLTVLGKLKLLKHGKEMHNYILKRGFHGDVVLGSALIDMYASSASTREAEAIFGIMSDSDITIWNSMIAGYVSNEDFDSAFRIFRGIWDSGVRPNSITLVSILPICTKMGTLKQGKEIHGYAIKSSLGMVVSVSNSLIDMYCKCGCLEVGFKVFHQIMEKNIITYNTVIYAFGIHGYGERALLLFDKMKAANIRPNKITFLALLSACSHAGLTDEGCVIYNSMMKDYHMMPEMEHYSCMVDLLGRAGRVIDACNIIRMMPVAPESDVLGSLLAACRVHNIVELADILARQFFREDMKDSGYHVLLSNIYASTGRWEDASKVRAMIRDNGLTKKPGNSWIEIGRHVHMFSARETTHPELNKIHEILDILLSDMMNGGTLKILHFLG